MRYQALFPYAGIRPLQEYFLPANDVGGGIAGFPASSFGGPGGAPNFMPAGAIVPAYDNYFGGVEFIYAQANGTINAWNACQLLPALVSGRIQYQAVQLANSSNTARPVCVAIQQMATGQFGWFAVGGLVPITGTANVAAAAPIGITGAGTVGATSAGKEIENAISVLPSTTTLTKNVLLTAGSPIVLVTGNNTIDGIFIGAAVSGTSIPANAVVQTLDPDGRRFTMSTGPGVAGAALNATASGGIVMTVSYTDGTNLYNVCHLNRPFAQGRIT
jgi:hypothetical protein